MRCLHILTAATLALALGVPAQQPAAAKKADLSVEAKLVIVPAVVRDKKNAIVNNLKKDDFVLQVDGKPQPIRYFDHDTEVPLTLGLLVDTSMSQRKVIDEERTASSSFLDKMLVPDRDKAFVIQFARTVELLQDVTTSRPKLQAALKDLDVAKPSFQQTGGNNNGSSGGGSDDDRRGRMRDMLANAGTALYDAVFLASDEVMTKQQSRRAIIVLTDGDDHGSKVSLVKSIESAQHSNSIVYAIYYKGEQPRSERPGGGFPGGGGGRRRGGFPLTEDFQRGGGYQIDGKKVLERMCGETGGRVFEVTKKQTVDAIYTQIAEELRTQYRLGFTPTAEAASDGYHQIALTLTTTEAKNKQPVQTREGYYTGATK